MKAEHRKELETNILADRMGKLVERIKTPPQRRSVLYVILALVVLVTGFVYYRLHIGNQLIETQNWLMLEQGYSKQLFEVGGIVETKGGSIQLTDRELTNSGKAARFQVARFLVWDQGIQRLGADPIQALNSIRFAKSVYNTLKKECENDSYWLPEALYNLALIEETLSIQSPDRLKAAQKSFEDLAAEHKDSGFGKLAEKRAKDLKENYDEIEKTYRNLQFKFHVPDEKAVMPKLAPPAAP